MRIRDVKCLLLAFAVGLAAGIPLSAGEADPWGQLRGLIGNWEAVATKEGVAGHTTFSFDLGERVILRRNRAEYPPKPGEKAGSVHEDLMVIYRQGASAPLRAIYFDTEGHTIHYTLSFPEDRIVFDSEAAPGAPRFRLVYEKREKGKMHVTFLVAPPGGRLSPYAEGDLEQRP
ncbi:MAG: hypothetical protein D6795_20275 [Deltaproteobacteria bacterium]|nr:MAG: hypothetical protein D6795_20275 [Deltaproteobacteria bacterium]